MNTKFKNFIDFFIESLYLLAIFLVPLYFGFLFVSENPFDLHKAFIFKSFFYPFVFLSVLKLFFLQDVRIKSFCFLRKYFLLPIILIFFLLLSVFWSIDPSLSFWGSASRQMGWISEFYFLIFSLLLFLNIVLADDKSKKIERILFTIFLSSFFVSVYAVLQYFAIDFLNWEEPAHITKRAMSSLGQPNFLASFLLLGMPITIYFIKIFKSNFSRIFFSISILLNFLAIIFSGSRGAWLSLLISFVLFLFIFYFKNKKVFFTGIGFLFFFLLIIFSTNNFISKRFYSALNFSEGSSSARVALWSSSFKGFLKRDWGYGIENQKEAIINYYQGDWASFAKVNVMFDRSHNILLDNLLSIGIFGTILFFLFYFYIFKLIFENIDDDKNVFLSKLIFWSISAYLLSLFFNFSVFATNFYFWLIITIIFAVNFNDEFFCKQEVLERSNNESEEVVQDEYCDNDKSSEGSFGGGLIKFVKVLFIIFLFISIFFLLNKELKIIKADYYFLNAKNFFRQGELPASILTFSYVREENPVFSDYYYNYISIVFDNYNNFSDETSRFLAKEELKNVWSKIEKKDLKSFDFILSRAQANSILGNFLEAEKDFKYLKERSPDYPNIYVKEARMNFIKKDYSEALSLYQEALNILPSSESINNERSLRALNFYKKTIKEDIDFINSNTIYSNSY